MQRLLLLLIIVVCACTSKSDLSLKERRPYFDIDAMVKKQILLLENEDAFLKKSVKMGGKQEDKETKRGDVELSY